MATVEKTVDDLLELVNGEMAVYHTCNEAMATGIVRIDEHGRWDVLLSGSGVPLDVARPTVMALVQRLNYRYRLKAE
jgi:hypothetical protein